MSSVPKKALKNAVYQKAGEDEEENSAVDAAHKLVRSSEWILQEHSSRNIRKNRSQIHKENRLEQKAWKSAARYQYQKYLEEHHPVRYNQLVLSGELGGYLAKLDKQTEEQLALIIRQLQEAEGVTEALKAANQLEWVRRMNSIRNRAEEIIWQQLFK